MAGELSANSAGSWLTSAAPLLGAGLNFVSGLGSSLFSANQARKNRAFQERMYNKQVADNIRLWNMQNEYNLPKNVLARMEEAGINPLAYFNSQGTSLTSSSAAQGGNAPSGDSARGDFKTDFAGPMTQMALMQAQVRNLNADSAQKEANAEESKASAENIAYDTLFRRLNQDVEIALKHANLENVRANTNNLSMQTLWHNEISFQTMKTMRQAREYEIKRFNLDYNTIGTQLEQSWKQIANDSERVKQGWKDLSIRWLQLQNDIRWTTEQIGALRWSVLQDQAMFLPRYEGLKLDNMLKRWDTHLKKAQFNETQVRIFNQNLKNYYLQGTGQEQPGPVFVDEMWKPVRRPKFQDMLVIPPIGNSLKIGKK